MGFEGLYPSYDLPSVPQERASRNDQSGRTISNMFSGLISK